MVVFFLDGGVYYLLMYRWKGFFLCANFPSLRVITPYQGP